MDKRNNMKGTGYKLSKLEGLHNSDEILNTFIDSNNDFIVKEVINGKIIRDTERSRILKKIVKINMERNLLINQLFQHD